MHVVSGQDRGEDCYDIPVHKSITADRVYALCMRDLHGERKWGICLHCGKEQTSIAAGAEAIECEFCGEHMVWGAEAALDAGYFHGSLDQEADGRDTKPGTE